MHCPPVRPLPSRFGSSCSLILTVDLTMLNITNSDHEFERLDSVTVSANCWSQLAGGFTLPGEADQLILYV